MPRDLSAAKVQRCIDGARNHQCDHKMFARCQVCGREQWAIIVWWVSHGLEPCRWCGELNEPVTRSAIKGDET